MTWCIDIDPNSNYECDQHVIRILGDGQIRHKVTTHETGHALGLTHGAEAYPVHGQCSPIMGVMRASLGCPGFDTSDLGSTVITNINYSY